MQPTSGISEGKFDYKAGKLIKVRAVFEGDKIKEIKITGDFFLHPEEKIEEIEASLRGKRIKEIEETLRESMDGAEYAGISPKDLTYAIREAWKRRK